MSGWFVADCQSSGGQATPVTPVVVTPTPAVKSDVALYVTTPDQSQLFLKQNTNLVFSTTAASTGAVIEVDSTQTFQSIDGFGFTLTGGSAILLNQLKPADRTALLQELFSPEGNGIGISYLRISIGASDLSDHVFTYNDLSTGQTDLTMAKFSLDPERVDLIPILKQILAINPDIKILGSPWTPPSWMKTNGSSKGGSLKPDYYDAYALYFVKYIQGMKAEGIPIDAITVQNEPLNPNNNPSLLMQADEQTAFIKKSLGPAFQKAGIKTKIILYDHNTDRTDYPLATLADAAARQYVDGSAFHLYLGRIDALTPVHNQHPDKNIYFTEQWTGSKGTFGGDLGWHVKNLLIGATRNWSRNVLEWNLASDPAQNPHTDGGCTECLGALTIGASVSRNVSYYIIAHAAKFVRPGSVRIGSTTPANLPNVAFKTPSGSKVLLVENENTSSQTFTIKFGSKTVQTTLPAGAVGTYVW
ncbi:glucosylceramidase [Fibrella sp. HMF5335]|uniref:Glucosylceramidase n=2 Tax=Fibrella rubiginis TaxID=2817060 RepID=A0A939GG70_9BACT|nr:glucosylceramidase [Fibrella rubiginis]